MCASKFLLTLVPCRPGCMLNRLATKAKLSLLFPDVTSWGETNCLQSSLAACCNISSALRSKFHSFTFRGKHNRQRQCTCRNIEFVHIFYGNILTHVKAVHVYLGSPFEFQSLMSGNLVQQVEVGSRVLESPSTKQGYNNVSHQLWMMRISVILCFVWHLDVLAEVTDCLCPGVA